MSVLDSGGRGQAKIRPPANGSNRRWFDCRVCSLTRAAAMCVVVVAVPRIDTKRRGDWEDAEGGQAGWKTWQQTLCTGARRGPALWSCRRLSSGNGLGDWEGLVTPWAAGTCVQACVFGREAVFVIDGRHAPDGMQEWG